MQTALTKALEGKGKRKFTQSVELIVNFRGMDFSKPENRLNLDVALPKGKGGKEPKIAVIGDASTIDQAKKANPELAILPNDIASYADKAKLKMLADEFVLISQPNLMGQVAKSLGQYLGPRGKLPRPIMCNVAEQVDRAKRSVRVSSKGKYLPVAQALVGTEVMNASDLADNAEAVYDAIKAKVSEPNIKSVYVKLTMGSAVRVV